VGLRQPLWLGGSDGPPAVARGARPRPDLYDHPCHALIPAGAPRYAWGLGATMTRRDRHVLFAQPAVSPSREAVSNDQRTCSPDRGGL
jgi:hypothetical protein